MMHGFARNARFWNRWVPAVAESRRVYRPDLLGCGESDLPPADYRYTPETIGAQIIAVLDALALDRVHWVGESSGGIIGLLLAAAHPERIASLVLCNTPTRISEEIKRIYALDKATAQRGDARLWGRRMVPPDARLPARPRSCRPEHLQDWVVAEMDRTRPDIAAAMHDCFETRRYRAAAAAGSRRRC